MKIRVLYQCIILVVMGATETLAPTDETIRMDREKLNWIRKKIKMEDIAVTILKTK